MNPLLARHGTAPYIGHHGYNHTHLTDEGSFNCTFKPVHAEFTAVIIKAMTLFLNELRYELRYKSVLHLFRFRSPMKEGTSQKYIKYMGLDFEQYTVKINKGPHLCIMAEG